MAILTPVNPIDSNKVMELLDSAEKAFIEVMEGHQSLEIFREKILIPFFKALRTAISKLPTIYTYEGARDYGFWKLSKNSISVTCSICGKNSYSGITPYCPNCGHPMKENENELERLH